jgi:hypothetical protein
MRKGEDKYALTPYFFALFYKSPWEFTNKGAEKYHPPLIPLPSMEGNK